MNNPAEHPVVASQNPNLIAEHINNVWNQMQAEKLTSYTNIFKAFSTLYNAQEMMAQSGCINEEANEAYNFIQEAKKLLHAAISQTDEDLEIYRKAMFLGTFTDA